MFAGELMKHIVLNCELFVKMSSYDWYHKRRHKKSIGLDKDVFGRHVIIIEDIY